MPINSRPLVIIHGCNDDSRSFRKLAQLLQDDVSTAKIMYSYEKRSTAPALSPGGKSRPFCVALLRSNKVYSREDIDRISSFEGRNVFMFKGGWYHDPKQDKNFPFCRHTWVQNIVFNG